MMTTMSQRSWPTWPYRVFLVVLFFGPPAAALFIATGLPIMTDLGWLARDLLSTYVCPTPAKSYELLGAPMAVCTRCWGATIGLWLAWFGVQWGQRHQSLPRWFGGLGGDLSAVGHPWCRDLLFESFTAQILVVQKYATRRDACLDGFDTNHQSQLLAGW